MSDRQRSTSLPNSTNSPQTVEWILQADGSTGGSDGAVRSRASADFEPPKGIDNENEAVLSHPQQTSTPHHNGRRPRKETFFGIPQPSASAPANVRPNYDDDYETRFPTDPLYQEASPNARVYRVYMEESAKYDASMTDEEREGLDVLLVFAGLFSAVLTTFVAQTSQSLQPDRATESTLLLREIAALQRAQMNGTSVDSIPSTSTDFVPASINVWVNGLWFTSLTLSLVAALLAVLMKQWIRHYTSFVSGTAQERSLIRQFRFMGLQKWHVPTLIGTLPVLMHLSLAIFFVGLTLFLVPLRHSIAAIVGSLSALVFVAYVATAALPLVHNQCPYRTPLSNIIHDITFTLRAYVLRRQWKYVSLKEQEHEAARSDDVLVAHAFEWLLSMSSNPSVHRVVAQAVGGLRRSSSIDRLANSNKSFLLAWKDMFDNCFRTTVDGTCAVPPEKVDLLERLFRSTLHIRQPIWFRWIQHTFDVLKAFPAPTLQWESAATALLWRHGICMEGSDFQDPTLAQRASAVVGRLMSDPREKDTRLPVIVWADLLAAASSCAYIPLSDLSDPVYHLNDMITDELRSRVCLGRGSSDMYGHIVDSISFEDALHASDNFVWYLLSPFDKHEGNTLDSRKVQRLLSLINAIVSRGLCKVGPEIFFGTCKELICELQAGYVTLKDQEAICVAADALLQERTSFQGDFGPYAVLLPSLLFLRCWKPHIACRSARTDIHFALIEINMFQTLHDFKNIARWLCSSPYSIHNNAAPIASLIASIIRTSLESRKPGPGSHPLEDSRWIQYLSLHENSATIVSMLTFQGTTSTPASVAQVKDDLLFFFSSQSLDCDTLQKCRTSLESHF